MEKKAAFLGSLGSSGLILAHNRIEKKDLSQDRLHSLHTLHLSAAVVCMQAAISILIQRILTINNYLPLKTVLCFNIHVVK